MIYVNIYVCRHVEVVNRKIYVFEFPNDVMLIGIVADVVNEWLFGF